MTKSSCAAAPEKQNTHNSSFAQSDLELSDVSLQNGHGSLSVLLVNETLSFISKITI